MTQIVFVDTPSIFVRAAAGPRHGDVRLGGRRRYRCLLLIVDAADLVADQKPGCARHERDPEGLKDIKTKKRALILNKIDGMKRTDLAAGGKIPRRRRVRGCVPDLGAERRRRGDVGLGGGADAGRAWLYPEDQAADIPSRLLAAEVTREKIYLRLHDELPYASAVETEKWEERRDGSVKIDQVIYVQRDGQKAIVLGKGGATIKTIGALAREELETLFGRRVHLFLFVKVREDWAENSEHYKEIVVPQGGTSCLAAYARFGTKASGRNCVNRIDAVCSSRRCRNRAT
jgi:GTP-binding protein Era